MTLIPISSWSEAFPNRLLKAHDLGGKDRTRRISGFARDDELKNKDGTFAKVLTFHGTDKMLVVNTTNALCIRAMFGVDPANWIGKRITLFPTTTTLDGEIVDAIRVRGSPDLPSDLTFTLRLPRKKPVKAVMRKTQDDAETPAATETKD